MSLVDSRARLWLPLSESAASLYPSDASGRLADPALVGTTKPGVTSTSTITGFARDFIRASSHGFEFLDPSGGVRLTRALSVVALVRCDVTTMGNGAIGTLIQRGRGGAGDPKAFELRLTIEGTNVRISLRWQTVAGADVIDSGPLVAWPTGEFCLIGAVREVSNGQLTVRYFINSQRVAGSSYALDCGGSLSASLSLGCGMSTPSGNTNYLDGAIDSLAVLDEAISNDEAEWLWLRLAKDQPDGAIASRRLVPIGVYSSDPSSRIQRELQIEGAALGYAKSIARRLRDFSLPERAWGAVLERWETVTGHSPKAGDWLGRRRARVLDFLGTVRGFALVDVKTQLLEPFDVASESDVTILESTNDFTEGFTSGTPSNSAKVIDGNGAWLSDAAAISAGYQEFAATAAAIPYDGRMRPHGGMYLWSLASGVDAWVHGKVDIVTLATQTVQGFAIGRGDTDEWLFVGVGYSGGVASIASIRCRAGVLDSAMAVHQTPWATDPTFFRIHSDGVGNYLLKFGASDAAAKAHAGLALVGPTSPTWAGFSIVGAASAGAVTAKGRFDDFFSHAPNGSQRLHWYAYRDPMLPGSPDMAGARLIVNRLRPAHTVASAIQTQHVLCDDDGSRCDREPIGA